MNKSQYKIIVFDADNTLRYCTVKGQPCPNKPGEWKLLPNVKITLSKINWGNPLDDKTAFAIASNQGGVALNYFSLEMAFQLLKDTAIAATGMIPDDDNIQLCPHHPHAGCECRKPKPLMLLRLLKRYNLKPQEMLFVGDRDTDEECANNAGCDFQYAKDFFGWK